MSHVFISYSKLNRDYARALTDKLLALGFDVWIDDRIDYGEDWWREIVRAIKACGAFIVIMTPESGESRWVQREVTLADELRKPTFPLLLSGDLISSDYWAIFVRSQYADVRDGRLPPDDYINRLDHYTARKSTPGQEILSMPGTGMLRPAAPEPPKLVVPDTRAVLPEPFEWCEIPAGSVSLEDVSASGGGSRGGTYPVGTFAISRHLITNAHYEEFLNAGDGYRDAKWWDYSPDADRWRKGVLRSKDSGFAGYLIPRTRVCWYDSIAFCRWLTARLHLPHGIVITLPTEQQWQRAAQGDDGRIYAWGSKFETSRCNTLESAFEKPTPVNRYLNGNSPFGVLDMSGNVWEWCLTQWGSDSANVLGANPRVVRGGSWRNTKEEAKVTCRDADFPDSRSGNLGFRIVCTIGM